MWNKRNWSDRHVAAVSQKLHQLLDAGLPLNDAFQIVRHHWPKKRAKDFHLLLESLQAGHPLSEGLQRIRYPPFCLFLLRAAEQHGQLVPALAMAKDFYRKKDQRGKKQRKAMVYPSLILFTSVCTLFILLHYLLPQFISLYQTFDTPLPPMTKMLVESKEGSSLVSLGIFSIVSFLTLTVWMLKKRWGYLVYKIPGVAYCYRLQQTYVVCIQAGLLLEAGVSILHVCALFREDGPNSAVRHAFTVIEEKLLAGTGISDAFRSSVCFLPVLYEMLTIAERTGTLGVSLLRLGEQLEQDLEELMELLASIGESIVTIGAGGIVLFLMLVLFIPMFHLIQQI